jgi:hypothetical protein
MVSLIPKQTILCLLSSSDLNYQLGISSLVEGVNLGFGSLRTLEGQFKLLDRHTLGLADVRCCQTPLGSRSEFPKCFVSVCEVFG